MIGALARDVADGLSLVGTSLVDAVRRFDASCRQMRLDGAPARAATLTTASVVITVVLACVLHLDAIWWAVISAYVSTQSLGNAALLRGILRICGTVAGASLAVLSISWIAYDPFACCLVLFAVSCIGIIGFSVSPYGYAWLLFSITFGMVALASLTDPPGAFATAVSRLIEVAVGTVTGVIIAYVASGDAPPNAPAARGWSGLLGPQLPITLYAIRSGLTIAAVPVLWKLFVLPGLSQMAITLVALFAAPLQADLRETHAALILKGMERLLGCAIGGLLGLALLWLDLDSMLPWLLALTCGVWLFAYVQNDTQNAPYVGMQAAIVLVMTVVQGGGPPASILPGLDRLAGIFLGLLILFSMILLISPPRSPEPRVAG